MTSSDQPSAPGPLYLCLLDGATPLTYRTGVRGLLGEGRVVPLPASAVAEDLALEQFVEVPVPSAGASQVESAPVARQGFPVAPADLPAVSPGAQGKVVTPTPPRVSPAVLLPSVPVAVDDQPTPISSPVAEDPPAGLPMHVPSPPAFTQEPHLPAPGQEPHLPAPERVPEPDRAGATAPSTATPPLALLDEQERARLDLPEHRLSPASVGEPRTRVAEVSGTPPVRHLHRTATSGSPGLTAPPPAVPRPVTVVELRPPAPASAPLISPPAGLLPHPPERASAVEVTKVEKADGSHRTATQLAAAAEAPPQRNLRIESDVDQLRRALRSLKAKVDNVVTAPRLEPEARILPGRPAVPDPAPTRSMPTPAAQGVPAAYWERRHLGTHLRRGVRR
jgi:hypothetical protein